MKLSAIFSTGLLLMGWSLQAFSQSKDPCDCQPQAGEKPYRFEAKRENKYDKFPVAQEPMKLSSTREWQKKYAKLMKKDVIRKSKRVKNTPEDSLYTLDGYLWYVNKQIDCDFHMQVGPKSKSGKRTVVEITVDNCAMQQMILDTLKSRGFSANGKEFDEGVPVTVIGLGFYDGQHGAKKAKENASPWIKKQAGTAWELHPVKTIVFR